MNRFWPPCRHVVTSESLSDRGFRRIPQVVSAKTASESSGSWTVARLSASVIGTEGQGGEGRVPSRVVRAHPLAVFQSVRGGPDVGGKTRGDWHLFATGGLHRRRLAAFSRRSDLILYSFPGPLDILHALERPWRRCFCTLLSCSLYRISRVRRSRAACRCTPPLEGTDRARYNGNRYPQPAALGVTSPVPQASAGSTATGENMSTKPQGRKAQHDTTPETNAAGPPLRDALTTAIATLNDLQAELRNAERIVNDGEDPEAAKEQSANAENALRRILDDPPATHLRLAPESDPVKRRIDAMFEDPRPSRAERLVAVQQAFIDLFRPLPLKHLRALEALVNSKALLRQRDQENIATGFTIGQLKALLSTQIAIRQRDLHKSQRAARYRVLREIDLLLAPYEDFLKATGLSGLVEAILTESIDSILHQFCKLEAKAQTEKPSPSNPGDRAADTETTPRGGRKPEYTKQMLERAAKTYEAQYGTTGDSKQAWSNVAELYGFPSGDAARVAVSRTK